MNKITKLIFTLFVLLSFQASAATYYVSPTGSDSSNGTALSTPLKTIGNALSKAKPADTVYVMTGVYGETVSMDKNNITLSAYQNNTPVIDGGGSLPKGNWGVMLAVNGNNNNISGFEVKNSNTSGINQGGYGIQVAGAHNLISHMNVHHSWEQGVIINGDYNTVEDSIVWQNARQNSAKAGSGGWGTGMSAARNVDASALKAGITSYATFRRNTVFNNWGEGLSCFEAEFCTMEDNVVYDNWTINLYISDTSNSLIQRNLVYVSSNPAIPMRYKGNSTLTLADERTNKPRSTNNTIINNFMYGGGVDAFEWTEVNGPGLVGALIANNTIIGDFSTGSINSNSIIKNNLVVGGVNIPSKNGLALSNNSWDFNADPLLAKSGSVQSGLLTSDYFRLLPSSPMIGKGIALAAVKDDFFKSVRKAIPDIGAHEFGDSIVPPPPPVDKNVQVSVTMPTSVRDAIKTDSKEKNTTMSKNITAILSVYLKK